MALIEVRQRVHQHDKRPAEGVKHHASQQQGVGLQPSVIQRRTVN